MKNEAYFNQPPEMQNLMGELYFDGKDKTNEPNKPIKQIKTGNINVGIKKQPYEWVKKDKLPKPPANGTEYYNQQMAKLFVLSEKWATISKLMDILNHIQSCETLADIDPDYYSEKRKEYINEFENLKMKL